ncbi:hypothetical protein [Streptomyces sp. NPDC007355]|uniref:hypothetical protein n=1 Tax=Streptomyces sp. NPDC007355 TaxID=3364778 RepID=UPI0036CAD98F
MYNATYIHGADDYVPQGRAYWTDEGGRLVGKAKGEPGQKWTIAPWTPPARKSDMSELVLTGLLGPLNTCGTFGVIGT